MQTNTSVQMPVNWSNAAPDSCASSQRPCDAGKLLSNQYPAAIALNENMHKRSCAALDTLEIRFPLAGHSGALDLGVHDFDEPDALVRRFEAVATTNDVAPLEQHFDDGRARSRRAEAGLFHGF